MRQLCKSKFKDRKREGPTPALDCDGDEFVPLRDGHGGQRD